jgi:hypothetical protein
MLAFAHQQDEAWATPASYFVGSYGGTKGVPQDKRLN